MALPRIHWNWFLKGWKTEVGSRKSEESADLRINPTHRERIEEILLVSQALFFLC
jgi:hypothetical protein